MFLQITLGALLIGIMTVVHAICIRIALGVVRRAHPEREDKRTGWMAAMLPAGFVMMMFMAVLFEAAMWAGAYTMIGAKEHFEPAFYSSMVTYTTLGLGDIALDPSWRILCSFEAAGGTMMFGWTIAVLLRLVQGLHSIPSWAEDA